MTVYGLNIFRDVDHQYSVNDLYVPVVTEILKAGWFGDLSVTDSGYTIAPEVIEHNRNSKRRQQASNEDTASRGSKPTIATFY